MYTIICSERRLVNDKGEITRKACDWKFSGGWKCLGLVRRHNFGVSEYIPFAQWAERIPQLQVAPAGQGFTFKNGKPRYTIRDLDHGTTREWGENVYRILIGDQR